MSNVTIVSCPPHQWAYAETVGYFICAKCSERVNHDDPRFRDIYEHEIGYPDDVVYHLSQYENLRKAVLDLYLAGRWTCDRPANEAGLWEAVRDAANITPGTATEAGVAGA